MEHRSIHYGRFGKARMEPLESRRLFAAAIQALVGEFGELNFTNYIPPRQSLWNPGGYLTIPSTAPPLDIAMNYLAEHAAELGVSAAQVDSLMVTDQYADTGGLTHLYLGQQMNGVPIIGADLTVNITREGRILSINGGLVSDVSSGKIPMKTRLAAPQALSIAATQLGLKGMASPRTLTRAQGASRLTKLSSPSLSLDPIPLQLQYVPTAQGLELSWSAVLRTPDGQHWYNVSVSDSGGQIVFANDWVDRATYNVLPLPVECPDDGLGSPNRTLVTDPWNLTASPYGWHDNNGIAGAEYTNTRGNNVWAQEDINANDIGGIRPNGGAVLNFDFPMDLGLSPNNYYQAAITNLFYWNNVLHDLHYAYGFTEAAGNFQTNTYGRGGIGNDALHADAQDGGGINNANFACPPDGAAPRMQMFLFSSTTPQRDSDLDNGIIVHEYGHGVASRLTGGPGDADSLSALQSGAMSEGWSDFHALMFLQRPGDTATAAYPLGNYVLGQPATGPGVRRKPYSFDMSIDPLTIDAFGTSGTGGGVARSIEVHDAGEIWASTLWDMNWLLIDRYGYEPDIAGGYDPLNPRGNTLSLQLVMDAMKIQPSNPSFKDGRDAILQADQNLTGGANRSLIWQTFARRGMGFSFVDSSSSTSSVTPAYDMPINDPMVHACIPTGTSLAPISSAKFRFIEPMDTASFDPALDVASFVGPGNTDMRPTITGYRWLSAVELAIDFAPTTPGAYGMTIGPSILAADDGHAMDQNLNTIPGEASDTFTLQFNYATTVGSDGFGYRAAGYPFQNIDLQIGQTDVVTLINGMDDSASTMPIGANTFNFYGTSYPASQIGASTNGLITFGSTTPSWENTDLFSSPIQPSIAVLWDDWTTELTASGAADSAVLYKIADDNGDSVPDWLIIEWSDVPHFVTVGNPSGAVTFQAMLQLNTGAAPGRIILNYPDLDASNAGYNNGRSATVGVKAFGMAVPGRLLVSQNSYEHPWIQSQESVLIGLDVDPPTIAGESFVNLTAPQYVVRFTDHILPPLSSALLLTNATTGLSVDPQTITVSHDDAAKTTTFTLPVTLADGNYIATVQSACITDCSGNPLDGDADQVIGGDCCGFCFFLLGGDANGDRRADVNDLVTLANNWQGTGKTFAEADFNYDGVVNKADLGILAANWHETVAAPAPALATAPTSARPPTRRPTRAPTRVIDLVT